MERKAQKYLDSLHTNVWLSLTQVPRKILKEVFDLLQENKHPEYYIVFNEIHSNLFIKQKRSVREYVLKQLTRLETHVAKVKWVTIYTPETMYFIVLGATGVVKHSGNGATEALFPPGTHIFTHFEWIANNSIGVQLKYKDEESEEGKDTEQVS